MILIYSLPSFYAHIISAIFLLIAFFMLYKNYSKIIKLDSYKLIIITLLFSLGISIHGISHLGLEKVYKYNPMSIVLHAK
jgi:hypothetical protein